MKNANRTGRNIRNCPDTRPSITHQTTIGKMKRLMSLTLLIAWPALYTHISAQKPAEKDSAAYHLSDTLLLEEVVITAPAQPIEQKGDTIMFNPNAYKVPEGAYLEALVRRIPGLSYDPKNHSLSYNGYSIKEITVNGEEFFKGNNKVALENIPAKFVSRLKVYDKETDKEKATGIKDTEKNYVLDLQTKKKLNGILNASVTAGYGNHKKKNLAANVFRFEEGGDNFSLIGQSGNRYYTTPDERNVSHSIGTNISKHIRENLEVGGNINYSYDRNGATGSGYNENYLTGNTQYGINTNNSLSKNQNTNGSLNIQWDLDDMTHISLITDGRYYPSDSRNDTHSAIFSENPQVDVKDPFAGTGHINPETRINDHLNQSIHTQHSWGYDINVMFTRKLNKKGSNLTLNYVTNRNQMDNQSFTLAEATYFRLKDTWGNDSTTLQNQYQKSPNRTQTHQLELTYTHMFDKKSILQLSYSFNQNKEKNRQYTYDLSAFADSKFAFGMLPDNYRAGYVDSLSNHSESTATGHQLSLTYNYKADVWNIQTRISATPQRRTLKQYENQSRIDTSAWSVEWNPSVVITRQKHNWYTMLNYSGYTLQPSLTNLLAPTEYVSPVLTIRSNPRLKPSFRHTIHFMVNNFTKGFNASVMFNQDFNSVTQATVYDPATGKRETSPVNINGNWSLMNSAGYNKSAGQFRFFVNAYSNSAHRISLIDDGNSGGMTRSLTKALNLSSDFRISYVPAWGNIDLNGRWDYLQSENSLQNNNTYTRNYTIGLSANIQLPLNLYIDTDATCNIRNGTGMKGNGDNEMLWNIRLAWKFLKEQRAELSCYWADILSQKKSYSRFASATRFSETYSEQLRGYFIVSLKYEFSRTE